MASSTALVLLFFGFVVIVNGQMQFSGKCNNVTTEPMFNITKYLGTWYEIEKYPTIFQSGGTCLSVNYSQKNATFEVQNTMLLHGRNLTIIGTIDASPDGKIKIKFSDIHGVTTNSEYWILGTDYTSYSVVWYCMQQNNNSNEQYAWILSRTKNESEAQRNEVYKILQNNKLDMDRFMKVNQTHCKGKGHKKGSASVANISLMLVFVSLFVEKIF